MNLKPIYSGYHADLAGVRIKEEVTNSKLQGLLITCSTSPFITTIGAFDNSSSISIVQSDNSGKTIPLAINHRLGSLMGIANFMGATNTRTNDVNTISDLFGFVIDLGFVDTTGMNRKLDVSLNFGAAGFGGEIGIYAIETERTKDYYLRYKQTRDFNEQFQNVEALFLDCQHDDFLGDNTTVTVQSDSKHFVLDQNALAVANILGGHSETSSLKDTLLVFSNEDELPDTLRVELNTEIPNSTMNLVVVEKILRTPDQKSLVDEVKAKEAKRAKIVERGGEEARALIEQGL